MRRVLSLTLVPRSLDGVKGSLHKVVEVVLAYEFLGLLTETGSTWLLSIHGSSADNGALEWSKPSRVGQVKVARDFTLWHDLASSLLLTMLLTAPANLVFLLIRTRPLTAHRSQLTKDGIPPSV
jgi:hypothetical protein